MHNLECYSNNLQHFAIEWRKMEQSAAEIAFIKSKNKKKILKNPKMLKSKWKILTYSTKYLFVGLYPEVNYMNKIINLLGPQNKIKVKDWEENWNIFYWNTFTFQEQVSCPPEVCSWISCLRLKMYLLHKHYCPQGQFHKYNHPTWLI